MMPRMAPPRPTRASPAVKGRVKSKGPKITREEWFALAAKTITKWFAEIDYEVPANVRYSCGFPGGGSRQKRIGECWSPKASADKTTEIFMSPILSDPIQVLETQVHEMVHAAVGVEEGHKGKFRACAIAIGLTGKMKSTVAGDALKERLNELLKKLPPYPHGKLNMRGGPVKKQTTRLLKATCVDCGYTVRVTRKWVDEAGAPHCPKHGEMIVDGIESEDEEG